MADAPRARKVAERIKVIVAEYLENRVKDDRLGFVTVTDVRVTNDLQHASIFYTFFGTDEERAASRAVLDAYAGRIRSAVGKGVGTRLTPTIEFIPDALPQGVAHVEELLAEAKRRDAELAAVAAGAGYAGDADPYRRPEESDPLEEAVSPPVPGADGADPAGSSPVADRDA
jgi:ribosome-binding factor A